MTEWPETAEDPPRKIPPAPKGLGTEGRALWRETCRAYDLRPDELRLLRHACATADLITAMQAEVGADLTVPGSKGQPVAHPLLDQVAKHRMVLARLLGQLGLPDDPEGARSPTVSQVARRAAIARWSVHG